MSELNVNRLEWLRPVVEYFREHRESVERIVSFFFSYAAYLAVAVFGALWSLMSYAGVDVDTALMVINHDIYGLALFTAVFLMLILGFSKLIEYIGKL